MEIENVAVAGLNVPQECVGGRSVQVDARHRGLRTLEDHVLGFLHVDVAAAQVLEYMREHTGAIAMADHQHVRRRRLLRQVHHVRHLAGAFVGGDDADGFGGDGFLRLIG